VQRQAQQMDVAPTILDLLNLPVPPGVDGRSLTPWISGDDPPGDDPAEPMAFSWLDQHGSRAAAVTTPGWRFIEDRLPDPGRALYDRQADPGEHHDLAARRAVRAGYLRAQLRAEERLRKGQLRAGKTNPDSELQKQLEALGYLR